MPRNNSPNIYFRIDQFRWNILKRQNADNISETVAPCFALRCNCPRKWEFPMVTFGEDILSLRSVHPLSQENIEKHRKIQCFKHVCRGHFRHFYQKSTIKIVHYCIHITFLGGESACVIHNQMLRQLKIS